MTFDLLEKYDTIWDKDRADIEKEFHSQPVSKKYFLKTKIKSYIDEATDSRLAVMTFDFALKIEENYYLQVFLKGYKYIEKEVIRHVTEDIEFFSSGSDEE